MNTHKIAALPLKERIRRRVTEDETSGCWNWQGSINRLGYGMLSLNNKMVTAHRVSYRAFIGVIPSGSHHGTMCVCHHCDNPKCVNPGHLYLATHRKNIQDMVDRDRANTVCGERQWQAKLTDDIVRDIRKLYKQGWSKAALGRRFGVLPSNIDFVVQRKTWKHVT